jgi:DNA topoisomerase-1
MEQHVPELVDIQFTAQMEQVLDDIAEGAVQGIPYLRSFYLGESGLDQQVRSKERAINPRDIHALVLDDLGARVRIGRYGPYLEQESNGEVIRVSLPGDLAPGDLEKDEIERLLRHKEEGPTPLGHHPRTGEPVYVLTGRYGPYVQLGENGENGGDAKPRRASLLKGMRPSDVTLEQAVALLELPRVLGKHPETGKEVEAGVGRFGPYVRHNSEYRSLSRDDDVLTIGLQRALGLLSQKKASRKTELIRELGPHPADGEPVALYEGRYGPFVKHGKVNAALPKDTVGTISLEEAVRLLADKRARPRQTRKKRQT